MISRLNEILLFWFLFQFFFVSTSFLVNIGKEMSLPGGSVGYRCIFLCR